MKNNQLRAQGRALHIILLVYGRVNVEKRRREDDYIHDPVKYSLKETRGMRCLFIPFVQLGVCMNTYGIVLNESSMMRPTVTTEG